MAGSILGWMSFSAFAGGQEAEEFADNRYLRRLFSLFGCFIRNPVHSLQVTARKSVTKTATILFFYRAKDFYILEIDHYPAVEIAFMVTFTSIPDNGIFFS